MWINQLKSQFKHAGIDWGFGDFGGDKVFLWIPLKIDHREAQLLIHDTGLIPGRLIAEYVLAKVSLPCHEHYRRVCPFPGSGWWSWDEYLMYREMARPGTGVIEARMPYIGDGRPGRTARRMMVGELLTERFGDVVQTKPIGRRQYLAEMIHANVVVHTGGAFANSWDHITACAFSLGIPVVQPEIFCLVGPERPKNGVHYLACHDDYSNMCDIVARLLEDRDLWHFISENAKEFYLQNLTPVNIWRRVQWWLETRDQLPQDPDQLIPMPDAED